MVEIERSVNDKLDVQAPASNEATELASELDAFNGLKLYRRGNFQLNEHTPVDDNDDDDSNNNLNNNQEDDDDDLYEMPSEHMSESEDEELDLALVEGVREKLKLEYEQDRDKYAEQHYNDIMSDKWPQVCWRYLLHCNKDVEQTLQLMLAALAWRQDNHVDELSPSQMCKEFWHMTPIIKCGLDKLGNSTFCIMGKNYRKPDAILKQMIRDFCTYVLFDWDEKNKDNMRKLTVIFDVTDTGYRNMDLDFMSWLVSIRDFLPTRFGRIYVIGIPYLIRPIVRLIISWLPANFRSIVHCGSYEQLIVQNIDSDQLPEECGGCSKMLNRIAPVEAPWMVDAKTFEDPKVRQAIEDTIGFNISQEVRDQRRQVQIDFERQLKGQQQNQITG